MTWLDRAEVVETTDATEEFNAKDNKYSLKTVTTVQEVNIRMSECFSTCDLYSLRWYACSVYSHRSRKS